MQDIQLEVPSAAWMHREASRFTADPNKWDVVYVPVPWAQETWAQRYQALHFPHLSQCSTGMIAYTPNHEKGEADLQVPIRPGRYLKKYYPEMRTEEMSRWANLCFSSEHELQVTRDGNLMELIYQSSGMQACMSHARTHYSCGPVMHPINLYAMSPDLALGYLKAHNDFRGRDTYTARCVLWPEKKLFSRLYGNTDLLRGVLCREGWKPGLLNGARLPAVSHTGGILSSGNILICPFIDHIKWACFKAPFLILQSTALGATHSVQHGGGICFPIGNAGRRPYGISDPQEDWLGQLASEGHPLPETFPDGTPISRGVPSTSTYIRRMSTESPLSFWDRTIGALPLPQSPRPLSTTPDERMVP